MRVEAQRNPILRRASAGFSPLPARSRPEFLAGNKRSPAGRERSSARGLNRSSDAPFSWWPLRKMVAYRPGKHPPHYGEPPLAARVANRAAQALRLAAATLRTSQSALGAYFRRMCARRDKPKAVTAAAHRLARLSYTLLTKGE